MANPLCYLLPLLVLLPMYSSPTETGKFHHPVLSMYYSPTETGKLLHPVLLPMYSSPTETDKFHHPGSTANVL